MVFYNNEVKKSIEDLSDIVKNSFYLREISSQEIETSNNTFYSTQKVDSFEIIDKIAMVNLAFSTQIKNKIYTRLKVLTASNIQNGLNDLVSTHWKLVREL